MTDSIDSDSSYDSDDLDPRTEPDVQPYRFEPLKKKPRCVPDVSEEESDEETDDFQPRHDNRVDNMAWCDCGNCQTMATNEECVCCHEIGPIEEILDQSSLSCITQHEGFIGNCLNRYVIQVSLMGFVEMDGPIDDNESIHELYRHIAYRRFTRWIWFRLGRGKRKVIPSCAVSKIREAFPSEIFTGFRYFRP